MRRKISLERNAALDVKHSVISDYVRLCLNEGIKPIDAYRELQRKLRTIKELKAPEGSRFT